MPRRAMRCVVDLSLHALSAPGVWLPSKEDLYLSVSMFGQYRNTRLLTSVFPLLIHEKFTFEKTYYTALDPSEVADYLDDELVIFELVQLSEYTDGAIRLASYSINARDFLFPYPSLAPCYSSTDREILLDRTVAFPGISPKLEFATKTVIKESFSPSVDALEDALDLERERRSLRRSMSSLRRSRSISPTRRYSNIDYFDTVSTRPPFVVRKTDPDLIGRVPGGGPDSHGKSKRRKSLTYSTDDLDLSRSSLKLSKSLSRSKSALDDVDAEVAALTSTTPRYSSIRSRPRSASPVLYRPSFRERYGLRPYSPTYTTLLADRVRRRLEAERRAERMAELDASISAYDRALARLRLSPYYYDPTLYDLELSTRLARTRSPESRLVPVDEGHYWTDRASDLSGRTHREQFSSNLSKSYHRLYRSSNVQSSS